MAGSVTTLAGTTLQRRLGDRRHRLEAAEAARAQSERAMQDAVHALAERLDRIERQVAER